MLAQLIKIFLPAPEKLRAATLYERLVTQARQEWFYRDAEVPDTLDGRFEMILLHLFLVLNRLKAVPESKPFRRHVMEAFMEDMDRSVRELGVSDTGVGGRVKKMAAAMYGRIAAYDMTLDDAEALRVALARNVYGTVEPRAEAVAMLAEYASASVASLAPLSGEEIMNGTLAFAAEGAAKPPLLLRIR